MNRASDGQATLSTLLLTFKKRFPARTLLIFLLTACSDITTDHDYDDLAFDQSQFTRLQQLQGLFQESRIRVRGAYVATENCKIYRSVEWEKIIVAWQLIAIPSQGTPLLVSADCKMDMEWVGTTLKITRCQQRPFSDKCDRRSQFFTRTGLRWDCTGKGRYSPPVSPTEANDRLTWWPCDPQQNAHAPLVPAFAEQRRAAREAEQAEQARAAQAAADQAKAKNAQTAEQNKAAAGSL